MSEISERADELITEVVEASEKCGSTQYESRYVIRRDKTWQELSDYIASLEAEVASREELVERFMDAGHKYWWLLLRYKDSQEERTAIDEEWDALVTE